MVEITNRLELIDQYIENNNINPAIQLLLQLIEDCVKEKDFLSADALRQKMVKVDPMALSEIVQAAEIIEEAKSRSLDQSHKTIWASLYEKLSTEEGNAFYYAMKDVTYGVDETIFKQGGKNPNLYFIDQGQLKLVYSETKRENLLKTIGSGHIGGVDTFFSISFCTTSLVTLSIVKAKVLNRAVLEKWKKEFPSLQSKLSDFCNALEKAGNVAKKGAERRNYARFDVVGKVTAQILNSSGKTAGSAKGELIDISSGGVAFTIKIPKPETARMLLGRSVIANILISDDSFKEAIKQKGVIVRVSHRILNDYLIHAKFDKTLNQATITEMAHCSKAKH